MAMAENRGRTNQKARPQRAIVEACVELMQQRRSVTMRELAEAAMVSEPTDYRFPGQAFAAGQGLSGGLAHPARGSLLWYCAFTLGSACRAPLAGGDPTREPSQVLRQAGRSDETRRYIASGRDLLPAVPVL